MRKISFGLAALTLIGLGSLTAANAAERNVHPSGGYAAGDYSLPGYYGKGDDDGRWSGKGKRDGGWNNKADHDDRWYGKGGYDDRWSGKGDRDHGYSYGGLITRRAQ